MDDVTVKLHFLVSLYFDFVAVSTQVVSRQVNKHDMFGVLLGIMSKVFCIFFVLRIVARSWHRSCDGVYIGLPALDTAVGFGRTS